MKYKGYSTTPGARLILACAVLSLAACEQALTTADNPPPMVQTMEIGSAELGGLRKLPARIEASERAELSFRVPGKVEQLPVAEGDNVAKGQVLAVLDQQDYKTVLADREAAHKRAAADFERAKQLIGDGYITRRDFDQIESRYKRTAAALGKAQADLDYTVLKAPFAGRLAKRYIENHEEVVQGQAVFSLRSGDRIDVKFDVPETLIILVADDQNKPAEDKVVVTASFDARPDIDYPLSFKEIALKADPKTKTFEVTYLMRSPDEFNLLPGMTADVTLNMPSLRGAIFNVPSRAVFGDIYMEPKVWVLDKATMTVAMRPVRIGRMTGTSIEVVEGLQPGDVVVTSPTNFLLEGQQVQLAPAANLEAVTVEST